MKPRPDVRTLTAFFATVVIGGTNFIAVSVSNQELPPMFGAALRFGLAATALVALARVRRLEVPHRMALAGASLYGALAFGIAYACFYYALVGLAAGTMSVIVASAPLFTLAFAVVAGQERVSARGLFGGLLAVAGIAVLSRGSFGAELGLGYVAAAVLGTAAAAASSVVAKGLPDVHPLNMNAIGMTVGALVLAAASLVMNETWSLPNDAATIAAVAWLVLLGSVALFQLFLFIVKRWTASATVYSTSGMPVVAVALGALVLDQPVTRDMLAGGLLVVAAVWLGALSTAGRPVPDG
jgi:drug/metabolite transporter (DMT)-like permease